MAPTMRCAAFKSPGVVARSARHGLHVRSDAAQATSTSAAPASARLPGQQLRLQCGVKNIPHPNKAHYGGEDAYFVLDAGGGALGIADGVGGWHDSGVNPADYSKTFMATARQYLEECASLRADTLDSGEWRAQQEQAQQQAAADELAAAAASLAGVEVEPRRAVDALDAAHRSTRLPGSATACVLRLDGRTGTLDAANLGDSGFLVVRDGALHFQSPAQQHFFDCPLQFGQPPDTDWAEDAAVYSLQLRPGDAIVLATDGLLDNLPAEDIVRLAPRAADDVQRAAAAMAEAAARNAADPDYESPYTREALQEGFDIPIWEKLLQARIKDGKLELGKLRGGKMDDITVVCAYVAPVEDS